MFDHFTIAFPVGDVGLMSFDILAITSSAVVLITVEFSVRPHCIVSDEVDLLQVVCFCFR